MNKPVKEYSAYGKWHVTTEGDCEGRTTRDLGVYEGYLDEIAFRLGRKAYYSLTFEAAKELPPSETLIPVNEVSIVLTIDSGTWDMKAEERVDYFQRMLRGRKTSVRQGTFFASVVLVADEEKARENLKRSALNKLTTEEKKALGL